MPAVGFAGLRQCFDQLVAGGGGGGRRNDGIGILAERDMIRNYGTPSLLQLPVPELGLEFAAPEARSGKGFRRVYFDPLQAESRTAAGQRCGFIRMSSLRLKAQHDPAALGVIAAQAAQSVALYVRTGKLLLDLRAKLQCQRRILTVPDPDAAALVAQFLHGVQHELPRPPQAAALLQHLKGALRTGLSHGADAEDASHRRRQLADAAILRQIVHGFQREKQMRAGMIRLHRPAHRTKVRAGTHLGQRLFDEQADLRSGGQRIHHIDTREGSRS